MLDLLEDFPSFDSLSSNLDPSLSKHFLTYYEESRFGLSIIEEDLRSIAIDSPILEIGSGIGLVSFYLASKGFCVTAIEPSAPGFGIMGQLQKHVGEYFSHSSLEINSIEVSIEDFTPATKFNYVFAINVLEHVDSPTLFLDKVEEILDKKGGSARFIAPNYRIPYEPHFNIPIIINKKVTYFIFKRHIDSFKCSDPQGLWKSLNWVNIANLRSHLNRKQFKSTFSSRALEAYLVRIDDDGEFNKRKGGFFLIVARFFRVISGLIPRDLNPIIDLEIRFEN